MSKKPFVHLHLHTCYSMLDGACRVPDIMDRAVETNMPAVAITDHGVMYGIVDFYKAAIEKGVQPILGCEAYVATGSRLDRNSDRRSAGAHHLVLLATDNEGYANLTKLISAAHTEGFYYKPRVDKELLAAHHKGLIALSSCLHGEVSHLLADDHVDEAIQTAGQYADIFGKENFFLEIQDHRIPEQRKVNAHMIEVSRTTNLPLVATNDVHYLRREHARAHEVLLCLQTQTVLSDPKRMRYQTDEFYMKDRDEMEALFGEIPEALDITVEIAERCNVELEFGTLHFPTYDVPDGMNQREFLVSLGMEGLKKRYGVSDPGHPKTEEERAVVERFYDELKVIEKTGFVNYFLVVWDFIRFAHEKKIPVGPGRGSGGGSLVAYALEITSIDPLRYDLIFERFLNPDRVSPPDFDIDFCQSRREEVIQYVKDKYGHENVAQITTFGSLGPKLVIRDVGRVLEIPYAYCDRLSKMVPDDPKMTIEKALEMNPEFRKAYDSEADCKRILDYAMVLQGLYRNPGTHAAGVVIGEKPLVEIVPLALDKEKQLVTQYTMEPLGEIGLLKMDFLGLKTLTVIQESLDLIKEFRGVAIDLDNLPFDDEPTYNLLNRGDTIGVFQLESTGMRDLVRRVGIDRIEDLIAMIALYRPGPMNMLPDYVDRKSGNARIKYDHALLEPILKETYGVMLYQEQVQQSANMLAGYSLGEADVLRRAMSKKKVEEMQEQREKFINGAAAKNRISGKLAGRIFDLMEKFAGYGFNKAHSAGYAIIAYQTAYLKANYPAEFMSALLSSEIGNFDKIPVFITEADQMGLDILAPDVNKSGVRFKPRDTAVLYGLAGIKNVGQGVADAIVKEREENGDYTSLVDFCARVDSQSANKKALESLVRCGAFDSLGKHRARLFNGIAFAMSRAAAAARDKQVGQASLFELLEENGDSALSDDLPACDPWPDNELLAGERELLGVYMSGHPLSEFTYILEKYQLCTVQALPQVQDRTATRVGGIASKVVQRVTKTSKETMCIFQLEDLDGFIEVLVFPETFRQYGQHLAEDAPLLVCGEVSRREDQPKIIAQEIYPLAEAPLHFSKRMSIHIPSGNADEDTLQGLKKELMLHPGKTPVMICLLYPSGEKVFLDTADSLQVLPDKELVESIEKRLGEKSVYVTADPEPCRDPNSGNRKRWSNGNNRSSAA